MKHNLFLIIFTYILIIATIVVIVVLIVNMFHHTNTPCSPHPHPNTPCGPNTKTGSPGSMEKTMGVLYLIPESPGFNIPELNKSGQIMDTVVAQAKFNKVVVVANTATYKNISDASVMKDQWDNKLVKALGLPIEKWAFVCCDNPKNMTAAILIPKLIANFPDIKGFLIDSEDGTIPKFATIFNAKGSAYKYGVVGAPRNTIPPKSKYGFVVDKFFSEIYTEGSEYDKAFYEKGVKSADGTMCIKMTGDAISHFWSGIIAKNIGTGIIPTVCGSGNCQESLYGYPCVDERLSASNISSLLSGIPSGGDLQSGMVQVNNLCVTQQKHA